MSNHTKRGTNSSANIRNNNYRNNGEKSQLEKDILKLLKGSEIPLSTSDLVSKLNRAWHTIDRACLMLEIKKYVEGFKIGNMNLWRPKNGENE